MQNTFFQRAAVLLSLSFFINNVAARVDSYYAQDLFSDVFGVLSWLLFDMALAARFIFFIIALVIILKILKKI